jgi:para-nitrobenzyl esterase
VLFASTGCSTETEPARVAADETRRTTAGGEVVGFVAENGAHAWLGIPFAASTAGENRWRAPRPAPPWQGVREATSDPARCAQLTNRFDEDEGIEPGLVIGSEDCLTLDVYAPANAEAGSLPVMVWIHGGGNVWGRSSMYDGSRLAANEDVVVVATQYRLGPFGWFAHESLRAAAADPRDAAASFATLDLVASLAWIRENVAAFGGDPGRVTVFGESHGAYNVVTLLASPLAKGLLHRAIIQSGGFDSMTIAEAQGDAGDRANPSNEIVDKLGARTAEALRAVPADELLRAYTAGSGFLDIPRVIEDGVALRASALRNAFASVETFNAVPIMTGTTRDEMRLFYVGDERLTRNVLGVFPVVRDDGLWEVLIGYLTRLWRLRAVDEPATRMAAAGHANVYAYRFDWDDGGTFLLIDFKKLLGAAHGFDIPFVFNRFQHLGDADAILFESETATDRERLSRVMGGYWASFARDGVPSHPGSPAWPVYGNNGAFLRLDTENDGGVEVVTGGVDSLESFLADLNRDPRLDDETRCLIVAEMGRWMYSMRIHPRIREATGCTADLPE